MQSRACRHLPILDFSLGEVIFCCLTMYKHKIKKSKILSFKSIETRIFENLSILSPTPQPRVVWRSLRSHRFSPDQVKAVKQKRTCCLSSKEHYGIQFLGLGSAGDLLGQVNDPNKAQNWVRYLWRENRRNHRQWQMPGRRLTTSWGFFWCFPLSVNDRGQVRSNPVGRYPSIWRTETAAITSGLRIIKSNRFPNRT